VVDILRGGSKEGSAQWAEGTDSVRVLIVEDEVPLAEAVARGFVREGIAVDVAHDGEDGYEKAQGERYDVVVLDRDLPGMSGDQLCRAIADRDPLTRVIMLTASGTVDDRVAGLSLGADDYLAKPFHFPELVARVRALYRRTTPAAPPILQALDIRLDPAKRIVTRNERKIELTRKEFGVLEVLMMAHGRVVSSSDLLVHAWNEAARPDTGVVRVTMMNLRRKLGPPNPIRTVVGDGYRMQAESRT
jgi:DNA-binding response OmpR family regulator